MESRALVLGLPEARAPGGLLFLDGIVFMALLEGLMRERGPEAEEAMDRLFAAPAPPPPPEDRQAAISRIARFGG